MLFPALRHEVSFWHGSDRLNGDLRLPPAGPHPVLLLVRESEHLERDYSAWLDVLADAGIASFSWDRPAARTSPARPSASPARPSASPARPSASVGHQAREVLAAIDRLRCLPDVDPEAVALLGWDTGGWAATQAATFSSQVAALILACTPAVPTPVGAGHDPRPTLSGVTAPVLALFGEHDPLVPAESNVPAVREALRDAGHVDHEVAVVRAADHGLRVPPPHGLGRMVDGRHRFGDWPAALTDLIVDWLRQRLRPQPVPSYPPPLHVPSVRLPARPRSPLPSPVPVRQLRRRVAR